jgi:phosphate-selective porin
MALQGATGLLPANAQTESEPQRVAQASSEASRLTPEMEALIRAEVAKQVKQLQAEDWDVGLNPKGGGAFIRSPDAKTYFRLYGYAQPLFTLTDQGNRLAFKSTDFRIRRARLDFMVDYDDIWKLFIEIDAQASGGGTSLIEGFGQAAYVKGQHYIRFGKYITPFSTENLRSSRALDTIERYIALNSLFGLPGLDVQFGAMLFGNLDPDKRLTYYVGAFNGNASAATNTVNGQGGNARDNNSTKDLQARVDYQLTKELRIGAAVDFDKELDQILQISSLTGARLVAVPVRGKRRGVNVDAHWKRDRASFDAEFLGFDFPDNPNNAGQEVELTGGYAQYGYWLSGSEAKGVQALVRGEFAELEGDAVDAIDGDRIVALTLGANIWFNGATRLQINAIGEYVNGNGNGAFSGGSRLRPTLLTELQVKF